MKLLIVFVVFLSAANALELSIFDVEACVSGQDPPIVRTINATDPQVFSTPGFNYSDPEGSTYPPAIVCQWSVFVEPGTELQLGFFNFSIEYTTDCNEESVQVYDGPDDTAPLIKRLCGELGDVVPDPITANGTSLFIRFVSNDDDLQLKGFLARVGYPLEVTACDRNGPQVFTRPSGVFATKNYPVNYGNNELCEYLFQAPEGQRVQIAFQGLETETGCTYDFLEAFNGDNRLAPKIGHYYGNNIPSTITFSGNTSYLRFESDPTLTAKGFLGFYQFV